MAEALLEGSQAPHETIFRRTMVSVSVRTGEPVVPAVAEETAKRPVVHPCCNRLLNEGCDYSAPNRDASCTYHVSQQASQKPGPQHMDYQRDNVV